MSRSYKIQQPITDLATLRVEKQRLREHIQASDKRLRKTVKDWPFTSILSGVETAGKFLFQSNIGNMASSLLGFKTGKKGFLPSLLKATMFFAGTQFVKHFTKGKSDIEEEAVAEEAFSEEAIVDEEIQEDDTAKA